MHVCVFGPGFSALWSMLHIVVLISEWKLSVSVCVFECHLRYMEEKENTKKNRGSVCLGRTQATEGVSSKK